MLTDHTPHARYRMYALYRVQLLFMFTIFAIASPFVVGAAFAGGGPPPPFALAWVAAMVWNAYWFLFRVVYDLELDGERLLWRAPLRSGEVRVRDVVELRPCRFGSQVEVITVADGAKVIVFARKGLRAFADALVAARPGLPVRFGFQARLGERLWGRSSFRPDGE